MEMENEKVASRDEPLVEAAGDAAQSTERTERRSFQAQDDSRPRGRGRFRRRVCTFCKDKIPGADYKDFNFLRRFVSDRGRIESRRKSGACAKHQRSVARAIKRARHLALIPYTADHIRSSGVSPSR